MKRNVQKLYFGIAYWKKRWVWVPFFYRPDDFMTESDKLARLKFISRDWQKNDPLAKRENKALVKISNVANETIVPWLWSEKDLKQLCNENDLPLAWVTDRYPWKIHQVNEGINRRVNRKSRSVSPKEYRLIRKELIKFNKQAAIVIGILWYLNNSLGKGGGFVTLEEVVRMQVHDISPDQPDSFHCISLFRSGARSHLVGHSLPPRLWKSLCRQINDISPFVFSTRYGGPLNSVQIDTYLKKAAKNAGINDPITSASLRPQFDKKIERIAKKYRRDASVKSYLEPVEVEEWKAIQGNVADIYQRRGRKSAHDPLNVLNAVLYHLKTRCPIRKLPQHFPRGDAVHSQYRRWKKNGILDAILSFRKAHSAS